MEELNKKRYRQEKIAEESIMATRVALKIGNRWIDGILLDREGKVLPLPYEVKKGETYILEVEKPIDA